MEMNWLENNYFLKGIVNTLEVLQDPVRIAAFDLDDTLIYRPINKNAKKWKILDSSLPEKIANLIAKKYVIVIFTNQRGMSENKKFDKISWRKAMDDFAQTMFEGVNNKPYYFAVYVAKRYDLYRKPNIGLWQQMKIDFMEEFNLSKIRISKKSFYVGDAAGRKRPSYYKKKIYKSPSKGDFSDTDRKFALNIGIKFLTPEEFFIPYTGEMEYKLCGVNPKELADKAKLNDYQFIPREKEMIVLIGPPGAGKTEFYKKYLKKHGYVHINRDTCKTQKKCMDLTEKALEEGKSVAIDNLNSTVISRMDYTSLAKKHGYKHIRALILKTDLEIAKHLNNVRHVYSNGKVDRVNNIIYNIYRLTYTKPITSEYFDVIEEVDFLFDPSFLNDPRWKKIFMRWSE